MPREQNYRDDPTTPKVLKVRCGDPHGGGKGALANENQAFTLSVTNDQILFQPVVMQGELLCRKNIICIAERERERERE